ncbi:MAG: leucine-rich repeat domain-containing protein [Luminiphilus sp.]|jgi:Leucine-rich repeat (LRR) protein|nr:leucine-rich repeat domain-containing protein [Luminiphilus sp.]
MSLSVTELAVGLLVASFVILAGCSQLSRYDITVNNVTVYEAAIPYQVEAVADKALENCLQQTLVDQRLTETSDLTALNCSDAGIRSLAGIEQFAQIRSLKLSGNGIRNLVVLERLERLEQLWLDANDIIDPIPVLRMTAIRQLDLADNPQLQCPEGADIPPELKLTLPDHCEVS